MVLLSAGCASAPARTEVASQPGPTPAKVRIERADDLPRRAYPVDSTASALLRDDRQFTALADRLEADLRSDLRAYDIADQATLKGYYDTLSSLALLRGDYDAAIAYADSVRALEDKPGPKLLTGLVTGSIADAAAGPAAGFEAAFRESFRRRVAELPYREVQAELTAVKGRLEILSPNFVIGLARTRLDPAAKSGEISRDLAQQLVDLRTALDRIEPVRTAMVDVLDETIAAHAVEKPDIWAARDVSLEGRDDLTPVTIAVWDTGVDPQLFPGKLFTNPGETPGNGRDDDGNGYIDDVHGIAHDSVSDRTTGALFPLTLTPAEAKEYQGYLKGFSDLQAGLDTRESQAIREKAAATPPEAFRPFFESLTQMSNYAHGTHVAGIATRTNPAARVLIGRMSFDWKAVPMLPTIELAQKAAQEFRETIEYFERHDVRVVNMSWGFFPQWFESALEANNAGGGPEERRELARRMFDVSADVLRDAMASAGDILFVAAAGNEDEDNRFSEWAPASFDLPNLITVGAVDRAGDEAAFTSYGKTDVYANGYEVESVVPGGEVVRMSGTSMASPQVVNLAAKLLALRPDLTVAELRNAILDAADPKTIAEGRNIRLLNPRASVDRLSSR